MIGSAEAPPKVLPKARTRAQPKAPWQVWRDGAGQVSPLRLAALAFLLVPAVVAATDYFTVGFGPRPLNDVIHRTGYWALIFLMVALAISPLGRIARFNRLLDVRRMIGVGAFGYIAAHLGLYVADQSYNLWKVATEIAFRLYLTIGFVALIGMAALAVTSTDGMVRRLGGKRWQRLHQSIYVIGLLALVHFFQQTKADVWLPTFVAGLFGWLIGYRMIVWWRRSRAEPPAWMLLVLTLTVTVLTFASEAIGLGLAFNVSPLRVLEMAFDFDPAVIRPGWFVLAAGLMVVAVDIVRARIAGRRRSARSAEGVTPA
jgi:methionine sulfoxide reductase heme-binding subunit